ncbi:MAG: DUF4388 domain-containing protein, partial [Cyanobacteria bacterium]|nr:DUF4388 domain-containing protein [Cyanobacteriota bacterium]
MADIRKSIDFEKTSRVEFAHTGGAPSLDDINVLYSLCKKVPAAEFVWVWKGKKSRKTFTLSACYPVLKDTGWWDYEVLDDPTWRIIDDRDHGNNEIWKQKTCDTELALLCCGMAEHQSDTQEFSFDTEGVNLIQVGHLATPVFAEILEQKRSQKDTHPPKVSVQIIHVVLKSLEQQRYTGKVIVSSNFDIGTIFFNQGVPVHAVVSHTRGDAAIEEIISWQTGAVNHVQDAKTKDMTITRNLDLLISSGFRLLELKRYMSECGIKYESYLFRTGKLDPAKTKGMDDQALKILAHLNRKCTLTDVFRDLELDPPQWAPAISFLANQKLIEVKPVVTERAIALKVARKVPKTGLDNHVTHLRNQKTGLPKFEALLLGIAREYEHFKGSKAPMSLIVFDIKVDDSALKTKWLDDKLTTLIARKIDLIKRPLDLFAHFKLTDYGLFLPNTDAKKAVHVGKRILKSLTNMPLEGRTASLEISLGIAGIPEYGSTVEALVTTAYDAMQHARDTGTSIYVGRVPKKAEESSEPPVDKTLAYRIHHGADPHKARPEQFDLGGLLTAAGIVSEEQWEQVTIISQRTKQPIARVLGLHEIDVSESAGTACEEVMHLINDKKISVDDGLNAVQLICNQGLDLQTALKRFGAAMRVSPLGDLLFNAGVVNDRDLNDALHDSAN